MRVPERSEVEQKGKHQHKNLMKAIDVSIDFKRILDMSGNADR